MTNDQTKFMQDIESLFNNIGTTESLLIMVFAAIMAILVSKLVADIFIKIAKFIASVSDSSSDSAKSTRLRRLETYLNVIAAMMRVFVVALIMIVTWNTIHPSGSNTYSAIITTAVIIAVAGATIGPLLRDVTSGFAMITERWYSVGDFIRVEPFMDVTGVVERVTPRSTRLRSLNGEVIWIHNQYMQSVKVTPNGLRTIDVDILCSDEIIAKKLIQKAIKSMPASKMTVANKLKITDIEKWDKDLWHFTVRGQTPPGREWLMDTYFVNALKKIDSEYVEKKVLVQDPMVRFADPAVEKSFKRAVRLKE